MPPKKRKPGRPPKPPGSHSRIYSTTLTPATVEHCRKVGDGSVGRGMRAILDDAAARSGR